MPAAPPDSAPAPSEATTSSVRPLRTRGALAKLALRGSAFEMVGYGASLVMRLGSNMIMSRLLFPRAFGLMALVNIFMFGLVMLSDVGIEPAVIQSSRGDEPRFLNTAWSLQILRGLMLYGFVLLLAWPLAVFYKEPQLFALTCAGSLSLAIGGFTSTSFITLRRRVALGRLTFIDIGSQVIGLVVMIPWAYLHPTVWALVGGSLVASTFKTIASHLLDVGYRNRFELDPEARQAITHFGKWIFGSSAFRFASGQADRLLLGRFLGVAQLGVYSIAVYLSESVSAVTVRITHGVLYPVFSRMREEGEARLREVYYRTRLALDAVALPVLGALTVLGPWVIGLLYDRRYAEAGWMLQAFAARVAMACVLTPCETCLFSMGLTRYGMYQNVVRTVWVVVATPVGWYLGGLQGLVLAVALSELPLFFVLWPPLRAAGILRIAYELRAAGFYAAGLAAGKLLAPLLRGEVKSW